MAHEFKDQLLQDMDDVFLSESDFGERVTLVRNGVEYPMSALFDVPSLDGAAIGAEVEAISHRPRLIVSSASLPGRCPNKGDKFILECTPLHDAGVYEVRDYVFEKDGSITYEMEVA